MGEGLGGEGSTLPASQLTGQAVDPLPERQQLAARLGTMGEQDVDSAAAAIDPDAATGESGVTETVTGERRPAAVVALRPDQPSGRPPASA